MKVQGINQIKYNNTYRRNSVQFKAKLLPKQLSPVQVFSLLTAGCATIISALRMGEKNMGELEKFTDIREEFSKKLEPAQIKTEKACWDFYINSNPETQTEYEKAEDELYSLLRDEKTFEKLKTVDKNALPKHEAKQLKDLIKAFDEELNTGEAKKALRKKEADIGQKYNTYVPLIDGKEVTNVDIMKIFQTETVHK